MIAHSSGGDSPRAEGSGPLAYATDYHAPVLCHAVVDGLITNPVGVYVDGTIGGGGHTAALLDRLEPKARVVGLDRDANACRESKKRLASAIDAGRLVVVNADFADLEHVLDDCGHELIDGVLLDLGVSSHQLDEPTRGFSYVHEGSLDMRMDPSAGVSAADVVNTWSETELVQALRMYGEEPRAPRIAKAICAARPLETTSRLAAIVRSAVPTAHEVKSLSRVFQALRIVVNEELRALENALLAGTRRTRNRGRMAVISYHSLEDRRVKRFFRFGNLEGRAEKDVYGNLLSTWDPITGKPITPSASEIAANSRSRSARLRIAERKRPPEHLME